MIFNLLFIDYENIKLSLMRESSMLNNDNYYKAACCLILLSIMILVIIIGVIFKLYRASKSFKKEATAIKTSFL